MGQGSGSVQDDNEDDADDDDDTGDDDENDTTSRSGRTPEQLKAEIQRLSRENKKRRTQARETTRISDLREDVTFGLIDAGLSPSRAKRALRMVNWQEETDPDEIIENLVAVFTDDDDDDTPIRRTGRTAPAMNNGRQKPGKETAQQKQARLASRFPALQGRARKGAIG